MKTLLLTECKRVSVLLVAPFTHLFLVLCGYRLHCEENCEKLWMHKNRGVMLCTTYAAVTMSIMRILRLSDKV
jgi:hypothetical protein